MKLSKSELDERQEQTLLKIEHNGYWIAFWGLLAAIMVQNFLYGFEMRAIAGEWAVFIVLCVYVLVGCLKNGIWDRRLQPKTSTNLIASLIAGVLFGLFLFAALLYSFPGLVKVAVLAGAVSGAVVFLACFAALSLAARIYRKRQAKLETEPEDGDAEDGEP